MNFIDVQLKDGVGILKVSLILVLVIVGFFFLIKESSDANLIVEWDDTKETSEYVFTLCDGVESWKPTQQT